MRFHLTSALFFFAIFSTLLIVLYQALTGNQEPNGPPKKSENIVFLESRVHKLEDDLAANHETVVEIKLILKQIAESGISKDLLEVQKLPVNKFHRESNFIPPLFNVTSSVILKDDCMFSQAPSAGVDIKMNDVLDLLPFDNPDGGVWKQGWAIEDDQSQWSSANKLKVFVVPHSHNDPGWLKTFEKYFSDQTEHILDNVVRKLPEDPKRRFIYAEISFFSLWWEKQPEHIRTKVKRLISSGQFELVNGGWVMPDEASTHYFGVLDQLITGHEWLQDNLGIKPNNNWAIDPFGLSPSMAYLWKMSGMQNMLIQRAHYSVKKHLARERSLEFRWKQQWDSGDSTEILCHMMPFYSYDIPHTCGPDPKVCCQFDFNRLPGSGIVCPWHVPPQAINDRNIKSRAELLLDQYRKKSQLFRTNVVLIPLGDDFRYDRPAEWDKQFQNYQKLFDYMNEREDLHVEAQFGTLNEYFRAMRKEAATQDSGGSEENFFPSLSGDFFSYSDRDDHYWTGYFTTRPFYKRMDRVLQHYIRSAEILFSLMLDTEAHSGSQQNALLDSLRHNLDSAHRNLGLFQHHDGITGTSKSHVLIDYANKLMDSIRKSQEVMSHAAHSLLRKSSTETPNQEPKYFSLDEEFVDHKTLPKRKVLHLNDGAFSTFYVFNTEAQKRQQLYSVLTDHPYVEVMDRSGEVILCQVDPVFSHGGLVEDHLYQVSFIVSLDPLSLASYTIKGLTIDNINNRVTTFGKVTVVNTNSVPLADIFSPTVKDTEVPISLRCGQMSAEFNENGFLQSFTTLSQKVETNLQFVVYQTRASGAYLFMPYGEAQPIATVSLSKIIIEGPLKSSVTVYSSVVKHQVVLKNSPGLDGMAPTINNIVDITARLDIELAMRLSTSIKNGPLFYTDLNGLQMMKRTRYSKLPLQANYYPISSQIYIEDSTHRFTVISATPLGATSLQEGQIEIMLDRQLTRDDNRGLGQGIRDNVVTHQKFFFAYEKKIVSKEYISHQESPLPLPSMAAHGLMTLLLHPLHALHPSNPDIMYSKYWSVGGDLPCDVTLVGLRHLDTTRRNSPSISLTLHRLGFSCSFIAYGSVCVTTHGKVRLSDLFPASFSDEVTQMTLSHLYEGVAVTKSYPLSLQPMQLQSYRLSLSSAS